VSNTLFYGLIGGVVFGALLVESCFFELVPLGVLSVLVMLVILVRKRLSCTYLAGLLGVLCGVSLMAARVMFLVPVTADVLDGQVGKEVTVVGVIEREPERSDTHTKLYVQTDTATVLVFADRFLKVSYGDTVQVSGVVRTPEPFADERGRVFDYAGYLRAKRVGYTMFQPTVEVVAVRGGWSLFGFLSVCKQVMVERLSLYLPMPEAGLAAGILLGVTVSLGDTLEQAFRDSGIIHIVVLSGYNMMLVVSFFLFVLAYLLPYRARLLVGLLGVWLFALLVGLSATVTRAAIMASLLLLVRFGGNTHNVLRALFLAGAGMLLINPYLLQYDIGFQLSFMATLALVVYAEPLAQKLTFVPTVGGVREFLVATLVTQFLVAPLLLYHMGSLSIVSVLVNVLVLPVVPVAMAAAAGVILLSFVWPGLAGVMALGTYWLLHYIIGVAVFFAELPLATVSVPAFSFEVVGFVYVLVGLLSWYTLSRSVLSVQKQVERPCTAWTIVEERETA